MPTISRILQLAPTCSRLAEDKKFKQAAGFGKRAKSSNNQGILIYIYWKILNKIYTLDPTYPGLQAPANYLWELCQKWAFKAANIVDGGGGGQIAPITPTTLPVPLYFIVDGSTFIADGETTVTMPASWAGYNIAVSRSGIVQTTVDTEPTYFSYNTSTRELILTPAAVTSELMALIPV